MPDRGGRTNNMSNMETSDDEATVNSTQRHSQESILDLTDNDLDKTERRVTSEARENKMREQAMKLNKQIRGRTGVQTLPVAQLLMDLLTDHNMVRDMVMKNLTGNNIGEVITMVSETQRVVTTLKEGEEENNKDG